MSHAQPLLFDTMPHVGLEAPRGRTGGALALGAMVASAMVYLVATTNPHLVGSSGLYLTAGMMTKTQQQPIALPRTAPARAQTQPVMSAQAGRPTATGAAGPQEPIHSSWEAFRSKGHSNTQGPLLSAVGMLVSLALAAVGYFRWAASTQPASQPAMTMLTVSAEPIKEEEVLGKLRRIIDPDLGRDIVSCGFIQNMKIDAAEGKVSFVMELTTPACPVKEIFENTAKQYVSELQWVKEVDILMTAQTPEAPTGQEFVGLSKVANIIAVASCKGGVGKSTTSVNLAYSLASMGARVGIFDADVYGPSLPTMVSPEFPMHEMDPVTKALTPVDYEGVKCVSFGFAGQGSAIMRGPMVSGVVQQMLTTTDWGELEYLIIDMPPGTGDIQLTLGQVVPITAAVIVTTPQNLAFVDVAKGIRMFSMLRVPCVGVVENMSYMEVNGEKVHPFGTGSGDRVVADFGVPHIFRLPITPGLSTAGDTGKPYVLDDPTGSVSQIFSDLGVSVVQEVAKLRKTAPPEVEYDDAANEIRFRMSPDSEYKTIPAVEVRRADKSVASLNALTGKLVEPESIPDTVRPLEITAVGNYAVQLKWDDGFMQLSPFEQLMGLA